MGSMERNLKFLIAYDGTDFHGWQRQPGLRTVQEELEIATRRVLRHPLSMRGSGRTDSGVHARGQVANVRTTCSIPGGSLRHAIGGRLPVDMSLLDVSDVHPDFDAITSADCKCYRYRIHNHPHRSVDRFVQRYSYHYWHNLDVARMNEAAFHFIGTMDFSAMAGAGCDRKTMVRTVLRCDVHRHLDEVRIDVIGKGFLYHQVRNMAGTLVEIGRGYWPIEKIPEILQSKDRANAGPTAPCQGLSLQWVKYPANMLRPTLTPPPEKLSTIARGATFATSDMVLDPLAEPETGQHTQIKATRVTMETQPRRTLAKFLRIDMPCYGCGYSLHGLPREGSCPECGLKLSSTLDGLPPPSQHGPFFLVVALLVALTPMVLLLLADRVSFTAISWAFALVAPVELLGIAISAMMRGAYPRLPGTAVDEGMRLAFAFSMLYGGLYIIWSCFGFPRWWV